MTDTHFSVHRQPSASHADCNIGEPVTDDPKWSPGDIFSTRRFERALLEFDGLQTAAGPDGIRPIMLQKGLPQIKQEFAILAQASFISGHVPKCWTNSIGIYLPKPGKTDYRNPKPSAPKHYSSIPTQVDGAVCSMAHGGGPWDLQKNVTNGSMDL